MPPTDDTSQLVTIAHCQQGRIGKRFVYASSDADGVWRSDDGQGHWLKPHDVGAGADTAPMRRKYRYLSTVRESTIEDRVALRRDLHERENLAYVNGVLRPEYRDNTDQLLPRNGKILQDAPRAFFTIDMDGLDLADRGFDALENDLELPDIIADVFDGAGLDWLITDCVMQLSSSHGLLDRTSVRAHIDWHLPEPMTLAEQKIVARYINVAAADAGISERLIDESIYEPTRMLFTSSAELFRRVLVDGRITNQVEPSPYLQRVRLVSRGQGRLTDIPEEMFAGMRTARAVARIVHKRPTTGAPRISLDIGPENVYTPIRARIYKAALETPAHRVEAVKAQLKADLKTHVAALPDHAERGLRRMRYLADDEFERSWQGALSQRYRWQIRTSQSHAYSASVPIDVARASLAAHMSRAIQDGIDYAASATADEGAPSEPPKHLLLRSPPGVGKTEATIAAVSVAHLMSERISYLAPSTRLAEEATARMRARVPADEYSQSRVRQMRGRRQVCKDPKYGALATKVESLSLSPLKTVCGYCPRRDACPWPLQHGDTDSGFIAGQHAHAVTTLAKLKDATSDQAPAVGIVDESMLGTLLAQRHPPIKMDTLRRWAKRGYVRTRDGDIVHASSMDLVAHRLDVITALEQARGIVPMQAVTKFAGHISVKHGDDIERISRVLAAIQCETDAARYYHNQVTSALEAYHEAQTAGLSTRPHERKLTQAAAQLKIIDWFKTAYKAIHGSLSVPGRRHVFGMRVNPAGKASVHIRTDLPRVMKQRHWIWLDGTADPEVWAALVKGGNSPVQAVDRKLDVMPGSYRLTQFCDKPYGKKMLLEGAVDHQGSNLARLRRYIIHLSLSRGAVLVVAQMAVTERLREAGMPDNVHLEHFNALRGLDRYKNVPCAVIIGRPQPAHNDIEAVTEALHYDDMDVPDILSSSGAYSTYQHEIPLVGEGRPVAVVNAESHPDPRVRAMRRQLVDAEVRQAIMRLRLFDRTTENPADLHVFGQCDTGLIAADLRDWTDAEVSVADLLIAQGTLSSNEELAHAATENLQLHLSPRNARKYMQTAIKQADAKATWEHRHAIIGGKKIKGYVRKGQTCSLSLWCV